MRPVRGIRVRRSQPRLSRRLIVRFPRMLRRFAALLAALGLVLYWGESAVADVHDGDAAATSVEQHTSVENASESSHLPSDPGPSHDSNSPHTCHCTHVHAPGLPITIRPQPKSFVAPQAHWLSDSPPVSVSPEPHFRPPVA